MPSSIASLMNRCNTSGAISSGNSTHHLLLDRIRSEVEVAHAHGIMKRQKCMRELYEREMEQLRLEMSQLRPTQAAHKKRFQSTPLGMVAVAVRYINQIPG